MGNNTVCILGKDYKVKSTVRSLFVFETIAQKSFEIKTSLDNYIYLYSVIYASNYKDEGFDLSLDDFLDAVDSNPKIPAVINGILEDLAKLKSVMDPVAEKGGDNEKKN